MASKTAPTPVVAAPVPSVVPVEQPKPQTKAVKPLSTETEPWTSFGSYDTRIFSDDFCHEKHLTTKVKATSIDGATFNVKLVGNLEKGQFKVKDELKAWFPLHGTKNHLHLRLTNNEVRVHLDEGITLVRGEKFNFYGSFGFNRDWSRINAKIGAATVFDKFNIDNRFRLDEYKDFTWYSKALYKQGNVRFGIIGVLDLTRQLIAKKDILLGYTHHDVDVVFKAEQAFTKPTDNWANPAEYFSNLFLTAAYRHNKSNRVAAQVSADPSSKKVVVTGLYEYKHKDSLIKAKLNSETHLSLVYKNTINKTASFSFGTGFLLTGTDKRVKWGTQLDLSI